MEYVLRSRGICIVFRFASARSAVADMNRALSAGLEISDDKCRISNIRSQMTNEKTLLFADFAAR
jgi:hypothetical protein